MITFIESKSKKCVGSTSLFINPQNSEVLRIIQRNSGILDKKSHFYEFPIYGIDNIINQLSLLDDVEIECLPEENRDKVLSITQNFKTKPFTYQSEGINWMLNHPNCLLLDAPGLGKTLQIIYLFEELRAQKNYAKCLIICGINSLKTNWEKEINKHSNLSCVIIGKKINSKGTVKYTKIKDRADQLYNPITEDIVILNVESLRDSLVIDAILNSKNKFDLIVCDECHRMKSPSSDQGKQFLKLAKIGKSHVGLSGTILVNSPLDAYVPLKFIGKENASFTNFKDFYCNFNTKFGHRQISGFKNMDILKSQIASCSLRRTKDILDLPPKTIIPEYLDLPDSHLKFYNDLEKGIVEEADRVNIKTTSLLGLVTRLREASTCPSILTSLEVGNIKVDRCCQLAEDIISNNEKVVIFSTFKEPLNIIYEKLKKYNPLLGTGDLSDEEVSHNIDSFQEDEKYKVFLATTSKCGTGITLNKASYGIFLDSTWTASLEEQCEDRIYRVGSSKPVFIYKLIANDTIDVRIQDILKRKQGISDYMIDDEATEDSELRELLGLGGFV